MLRGGFCSPVWGVPYGVCTTLVGLRCKYRQCLGCFVYLDIMVIMVVMLIKKDLYEIMVIVVLMVIIWSHLRQIRPSPTAWTFIYHTSSQVLLLTGNLCKLRELKSSIYSTAYVGKVCGVRGGCKLNLFMGLLYGVKKQRNVFRFFICLKCVTKKFEGRAKNNFSAKNIKHG